MSEDQEQARQDLDEALAALRAAVYEDVLRLRLRHEPWPARLWHRRRLRRWMK